MGGKGSYDYYRGVNVASGGTFVMDGCTICDYMYRGEGGAIYCNGSMTMNGGTISGSDSTGAAGGGRNRRRDLQQRLVRDLWRCDQ